jgi:hypothetical protein
MALRDILNSGINNINRAASNVSSGLQSFDVNQFNQGLTRGLDQLGGQLSQAGGLLEQAGTNLLGGAQSALSRINTQLPASFTDLERTFQGTIENLDRANIVQLAENVTQPLSEIARNPEISGLFNQDRISQTLNGIRQNINVLPENFSAITTSLNEVSSAVNNLSSAASSLTSGARQLFTSTYDDAILRQLRISNSSSGNRSDSPTDFQLTPSETGDGLALPNPLRGYASYTYNLELSVLSPYEINSPEDSYRNGLTNSIVKSGGGNYNNRVTTYDEDVLGKHAEYYIDDLETVTLSSPNPNTGLTPGSNIKFTVTEPYSMGKFLEALAIGATQAGYNSYIEAPYVLKISFRGLDQEGRIISDLATPPKFMPIKLTNIEFEVKSEGSMYQCEAIPWNELALTQQSSTIRTDVNLTGTTVIEALETGNPTTPQSPPLTGILNGRGETIAEAGAYNTPDRYIIMFPTDSQGATRAVTAARESNFTGVSGATTGVTETQAAQLRASGDLGILNAISANQTQIIPDGSVYEVLRQYAATNVNVIGQSPILDNVLQDGDRTNARHDHSYDEFGTVIRSRVESGSDSTARNGQYARDTSIISIIEDLIMTSEYGRNLSEQAQANAEEGLREWFRIETQLFIEEDPATQVQRGTPPKIYVYSVVPYFPDESMFQGPSRRSENTQTLRNLALKEYNYYYTGLNEDVLDFRIEFKTAFFQNLFADLGQLSSSQRIAGSGEVVNPNALDHTSIAPPGIGPVNNGSLSEPSPPVEETTGSTDSAMGGIRGSATIQAKRNIAQQFHDTLINSNVDMVNAEMEIWGDPYWIPESGMGNYNAAPSGIHPNLTSDGGVTTQHSGANVLVNFRTPFDYSQEAGRMQFSDVVKPFSGVYQVTRIENNFSGGKFTQMLKMIRKRGQGDQGTGQTDNLQLGNQVLDRTTAGGAASGAGTAGQPNNSGATRSGAAGDGLRGGGGGGGGGSGQTGPNGETVPTQGGGQLATITTSIRGLETQVAALVAPNLQGLIDELEQEYGYEIRSLGGYVDRYIRGTTTKSWHASGIAIDINPYPDNADGSRLTTNLPYPPNGSEMRALAAKYGLGWGGAWTGGYYDAMHFSAATNEQGTYQVQRGVIPAAPPAQTPTPDTSGTGTSTTGGIAGTSGTGGPF